MATFADQMSENLKALGTDARVRGDVVEIAQSPISQIKGWSDAIEPYVEGANGNTHVQCVIPDPRLQPNLPNFAPTVSMTSGYPGKIGRELGRWTITDNADWFPSSAYRRWTSRSWLANHWEGYALIAQRLLEAPVPTLVKSIGETIWEGMAELGVPARLTDGLGKELIDIGEGPIRQIRVEPFGFGGASFVKCIVPDHRRKTSTPDVSVTSTRNRLIPLIGPVTAVVWKHLPTSIHDEYEDELDADDRMATRQVIDALEANSEVCAAVARARLDLDVRLDVEGWQISSSLASAWTNPRRLANTWDGHRAVAEHLLAAQLPEPNADQD